MLSDTAESPEPIILEVAGAMPVAEQRYAVAKIRRLAVQAPVRVDGVRLTIIALADPAAAHRVRIRASFDVEGRILRSAADGESVYEAVDTLRHRTCMQLARLHSRASAWTFRLV